MDCGQGDKMQRSKKRLINFTAEHAEIAEERQGKVEVKVQGLRGLNLNLSVL